MKNLLYAGLLFLVACTKTTVDKQATNPVPQQDPQVCSFGLSEFNLAKRPAVSDEPVARRPKNGSGSTGSDTPPPPPPPPPPSGSSVILLDFDGHSVSGTSWNYNGTINCTPANLTAAAIAEIVNRVSNDYSPFNVVVTTDENIFTAANPYKRTRVILTETWEWYGQAGGVSFINSFKDGSGNPCFVFTSLLNYNIKNISEAASHEAGHTIGLYHQSVYDANCVRTSTYNSGTGSGETSWGPIMGVAYGRNLSLWHSGTNSNSCTTIQDDLSVIASVVGYKTDDYSNIPSGSTALSGTVSGMINSSTDVDYFSLSTGVTANINVTPFNVGVNNAGANVDLVLKIYNSIGQLISTVDNVGYLNTAAIVNPGTYYVSVSTVTNTYATTTYGMLGKYSISIN